MFALEYCLDCERSYRNISLHFRTQKHLRNAEATERAHAPSSECSICMRVPLRTEWVKCRRCVHTWCTECHKSLTRCPYCRFTSGPPPVSRDLIRLFRHMEQWRTRTSSRNPPADHYLQVRLSWEEIGFISHLLAVNTFHPSNPFTALRGNGNPST